MRVARRTVPTSMWTSSSRRRSSPSTCIDWIATTSCTTRTFAGRAPASSSIHISGAGCAPCCTTAARRSTTRTWTNGGGERAYARLTRGASTTSRRTPEEESPENMFKWLFRRLQEVPCTRVFRPTRCSISIKDFRFFQERTLPGSKSGFRRAHAAFLCVHCPDSKICWTNFTGGFETKWHKRKRSKRDFAQSRFASTRATL